MKYPTDEARWRYSFETPEPLTLDQFLKLRAFFHKTLWIESDKGEVPWITSEVIIENSEEIKK